jgi:hypothetical protein
MSDTNHGDIDADLLRAAADLLAACELVERWMLGGQPVPFSDQKVLDVVSAAIAKAKKEMK